MGDDGSNSKMRGPDNLPRTTTGTLTIQIPHYYNRQKFYRVVDLRIDYYWKYM
ncbi:MAG: hypothetical protein LBB45_04245 [Methanobrevibacter sp.]|jgi:hypothetical protein|nr:hypothetical protein [Candidatus Methanovirga basalitermitum]